MSKFQIAILGIFIVSIVSGVVAFATYKGTMSSNTDLPAITIWGTFPEESFNIYISKINQDMASPVNITYIKKTQNNFSGDFIAALARGQGPDAILIPADMILPHLDKITPIPYTAMPQGTFNETFIQEGRLYFSSGGILALPFAVDPLIMYWNRDMFSMSGIATYPKTWDEFTGLNKKLTERDRNGNIRKSAIAMGSFGNIPNAREVLGTLFLQTGNTVIKMGEDGLVNTLKNTNYPDLAPALDFFTKFIDPNNADYSWNNGMPSSKTAFLSGTLATYFGFASELSDIKNKNPNLNFDVAPIPQLKNSNTKATYARMYGLSIVRSSTLQNSVYQIMSILTSPANMATLSETTYLPSVNIGVIAQGSKDQYISIFNKAALIGKTWLDIDPAQSYQIFSNMTNAVTSGALGTDNALEDASDQYEVALNRALQ